MALVIGPDHELFVDEIVKSHPVLPANMMHDVSMAALIKEHGIRRIDTRDTDFHCFKFLEVMDPLE